MYNRHSITAQQGGRIITRYCTFNLDETTYTLAAWNTHGQDEWFNRGARRMECYECTFARVAGGGNYAFSFYGGRAVIWNNTLTGMVELSDLCFFGHSACSQNVAGDAFTITYVGAGACTMTITGNALTTTAPSGEDLDLDLTAAAYDTFDELVDYIHGRGDYTCVKGTRCPTHSASTLLDDIAAQDITGGHMATHNPPLQDQVDDSYFWGNTVNGQSFNTPHETPICSDELDYPYFSENSEWFEYAMPAYSAYTYPHPSRHDELSSSLAVKGALIKK